MLPLYFRSLLYNLFKSGDNMNVLDLFAGAGGFSLGFQLAGYNVVGGVEIDKWASETFRYNHPLAKMLVWRL